MVNTFWEEKEVEIKGKAFCYKYKDGVKKVCKGPGASGMVTVGQDFIGKKFKVYLVPIEDSVNKIEANNDTREEVLPPQN